MVRSMTGFGLGSGSLGAAHVTMEVRSVNHRFLDVRARMPREMTEHGTWLEQHARGQLRRGRVEISVRYDAGTTGPVAIDRRRALEVYRTLESIRTELGVEAAVPVAALASVPELFVSVFEGDPEGVRSVLSRALAEAVASLEIMRAREGEHLHGVLQHHVSVVARVVRELVAVALELPQRYRRRLRERVARLLAGQEFALDSGRLEQEVAILADHSDVTEELARLESHCAQFHSLLAADEPVGRKLEFLLQEMSREANTIGAKAGDADVAQRVVEMKAELERAREQVQNVE